MDKRVVMFNIFKKVLKRTNDAIKDIIPTKQRELQRMSLRRYC